jgi:hypothetical protein
VAKNSLACSLTGLRREGWRIEGTRKLEVKASDKVTCKSISTIKEQKELNKI